MMEPTMPGAWICDKCGFILQQNYLHSADGQISANESDHVEGCPNDGTAMRGLTWREVNTHLFDRLALEVQRMNWLDAHCSFVAGDKYNLGPFRVGELRKLADAGIAADKSGAAERATIDSMRDNPK